MYIYIYIFLPSSVQNFNEKFVKKQQLFFQKAKTTWIIEICSSGWMNTAVDGNHMLPLILHILHPNIKSNATNSQTETLVNIFLNCLVNKNDLDGTNQIFKIFQMVEKSLIKTKMNW